MIAHSKNKASLAIHWGTFNLFSNSATKSRAAVGDDPAGRRAHLGITRQFIRHVDGAFYTFYTTAARTGKTPEMKNNITKSRISSSRGDHQRAPTGAIRANRLPLTSFLLAHTNIFPKIYTVCLKIPTQLV